MYVYPALCVLEVLEELTSLKITGEYTVVVHTIFIEGKTVEKFWPRGFFACPKWVYRGKKLLRKKLW